MAHENRKKSLLKKHGLSGVNKPKRTPGHKTKSHMVLAQDGHNLKLIRFGQQGVRGARAGVRRDHLHEGGGRPRAAPGRGAAVTEGAGRPRSPLAKRAASAGCA